MASIPFSPDTTKNDYFQIDLDVSHIRTAIEKHRQDANEQVLVRNVEFARSVVFAKKDLQEIINKADCNRIRLTHVVAQKRADGKYASSLLAVGQDLMGKEMANAPIFVGTPGAMISTGTTVKIDKDKLKFTESPTTGITWINHLPPASKALNLHDWLQTAFHDQTPVFLPLLARFDKEHDWPLISTTNWIAFVPAIFKCAITNPTLTSPTGWYCTFIAIALDDQLKPLDGKLFYLLTDMWRPNYPVSNSFQDESSGFIQMPKLPDGPEGDPVEYRDAE